MLAFVGEPISQHLARSPEGFLIARNAIIGRTAVKKPQYYAGHEVGIRNSDQQVAVYRFPSEVFSPRALASGEGKPVVSTSHPPRFLGPANTNWYQRGVMMNLHPGDELPDGEQGLLADLLLYDESLIALVESDAMRECSLGYSCDYVDQGDGTFRQENISINHVCVLPTGRAGKHVKIVDSGEDAMDWERINDRLEKIAQRLERLSGIKGKPTADAKKTLYDEVQEIRRSANLTERLTASGVGPAQFAEELRKHNQAYNDFSRAADEGQAFSDAARRAGREMAERFTPKACRRPVTDSASGDEQDWARAMNQAGARMRGK